MWELLHQVLRQWSWIGFILGTWAIALAWRRRGRKHVARRPELAAGYRRLSRRLAFWGSAPWLVMGLGILWGDVSSIAEYGRLREADPWALAWVGSLCAIWGWAVWWVFVRGGAEALVEYPGLLNPPLTRPEYVKLACLFPSAVGIVVLVMTLFGGAPDGRPGDGQYQAYKMVFVVYDAFWRTMAITFAFLAIGVALLLGAIAWIRSIKLPKWWFRKEGGAPAFLLVFSVLWLVFWCATGLPNIWYCYRLVSIYRNGQAQMAEGTAHVLRRQPAGGHADGDLIDVNGVHLVVDNFLHTPAYKKTIAHGGVLTEGRYVRIWHYNELVLRIDVRNE